VPIHSVVGSPIAVPKTREEDITQELVDEYHGKYCDELQKIFDEWKEPYEEEKTKRISELEQDKDRANVLADERFISVKEEGEAMKIE